MSRHRATKCDRKGHSWRQKVAYVLGYDVCRRRGCDAERTNPRALPPWHEEYEEWE